MNSANEPFDTLIGEENLVGVKRLRKFSEETIQMDNTKAKVDVKTHVSVVIDLSLACNQIVNENEKRTSDGVMGTKFNRYAGEYKGDKKNGRGVFTYVNGIRYDGEYKDDKMDGRGVCTWASGDRYDGEYKDDKRNGRGVLTFANGTKQDGQWKDDIFLGVTSPVVIPTAATASPSAVQVSNTGKCG